MKLSSSLTFSAMGVVLVGLLQAQVGGIIGQYLPIFYTDTIGIDPSVVSTLLFVSVMWDALNDPVEGIIMDNVRYGRWGKYRMISLWSNLFLTILTIMLFWIPSSWSLTTKIVYAFIINIIWRVAYSFVPVLPLTANVTANPTLRMRINSMQRLLILAVGLLVAYTLPLVERLGQGNKEVGYRYTILLFVLPLALFSLIGGLLIKEKAPAPNQKEYQFRYKDFLYLMQKNRPFNMFLLFSLSSNMIGPFLNAGFIYYISYTFGAQAMPGLFVLAMSGFAVGVMLAGLLVKWIERKRLIMLTYLLLSGVFVAFYLLSQYSLRSVSILYGTVNLLMGIGFIASSTLNMEVMDYHEVHFGVRPAGMISSVSQFISKAGYAVAGLVVLRTLALVGFVANQPMSPTVMSGLTSVTMLIPAAFALISVFVVKLYPISDHQMQAIATKLSASNKESILAQ
jgi:glycoside/pentoside/hexuronide:cation symporter, GPH family